MSDIQLQEKHTALQEYLSSLSGLVVAFSGGVDSTYLLKSAYDVLGEHVIAVTARSCSFPKRELDEAMAFCAQEGITHLVCDSEELALDGFSDNPVNRCYLCKNELFTRIRSIATQRGIPTVADGSNLDDEGDYRPGLIAVREQQVVSPLRLAKLTKQDIRDLSRELGLRTWDKQSFACLASRFPYGEKITPERLAMIDKAEQLLLDLGFRQVRVRYHDGLARIETGQEEFALLLDDTIRIRVHDELRQLGFTYVSIDLLGYRTGSMNEVLS